MPVFDLVARYVMCGRGGWAVAWGGVCVLGVGVREEREKMPQRKHFTFFIARAPGVVREGETSFVASCCVNGIKSNEK